jgi:hypothetical protein
LEGIGIRGVCEAQGHAEFTIIVPNVPKASRDGRPISREIEDPVRLHVKIAIARPCVDELGLCAGIIEISVGPAIGTTGRDRKR